MWSHPLMRRNDRAVSNRLAAGPSLDLHAITPPFHIPAPVTDSFQIDEDLNPCVRISDCLKSCFEVGGGTKMNSTLEVKTAVITWPGAPVVAGASRHRASALFPSRFPSNLSVSSSIDAADSSPQPIGSHSQPPERTPNAGVPQIYRSLRPSRRSHLPKYRHLGRLVCEKGS